MGPLQKVFGCVERIIHKLSKGFVILAAVIIIGLVFLTTSDVIGRYTLNNPISGVTEYTELAMVPLGFLVFAWLALKGSHVKVDLLVSRFSRRGQAVFGILNCLLAAGVSLGLCIASFLESLASRRSNLLTFQYDLPYYPFYMIVSFGYFLLFLTILVLLVHNITEAIKSES